MTISNTLPYNPETLDRIRGIHLFSALSDAQLEPVIRSTRAVALDVGEILFRQGEKAERFFFVLRGQIKLFRLSPTGDEKVIHIVMPRRTFAEAVVFMRKGYPVNAMAIDASELYAFDTHAYLQTLQDSSETCFQLMADMSQRLVDQIDEIDRLTLQNATCRLVGYLLEQCTGKSNPIGESAVELSTPKHVIASKLSIQPETFSRILKRLARGGHIKVDGNVITLPNADGLRDYLQSAG